MTLVVVNLVDSVFFTNKHMSIMASLFTTMTMIMLELPFVLVISKCDNLKNFDIKIGEIFEYKNLNKFYREIIEIVKMEGLLDFEIMDYDYVESMMYLQYVIDKASGYLYNEEPQYEIIDKETILKHYEQ